MSTRDHWSEGARRILHELDLETVHREIEEIPPLPFPHASPAMRRLDRAVARLREIEAQLATLPLEELHALRDQLRREIDMSTERPQLAAACACGHRLSTARPILRQILGAGQRVAHCPACGKPWPMEIRTPITTDTAEPRRLSIEVQKAPEGGPCD